MERHVDIVAGPFLFDLGFHLDQVCFESLIMHIEFFKPLHIMTPSSSFLSPVVEVVSVVVEVKAAGEKHNRTK